MSRRGFPVARGTLLMTTGRGGFPDPPEEALGSNVLYFKVLRRAAGISPGGGTTSPHSAAYFGLRRARQQRLQVGSQTVWPTGQAPLFLPSGAGPGGGSLSSSSLKE